MYLCVGNGFLPAQCGCAAVWGRLSVWGQARLLQPKHQVRNIKYGCVAVQVQGVWRYRYRLYRTDQHRTDNYRYSNGQRFGAYWLYWVISGYIYRTGELWELAGLTVHVTGMLVDRSGTPCVGGRGEV